MRFVLWIFSVETHSSSDTMWICGMDVWQIEVMFEKYNFGGVFIQIQAVLTLYAQGIISICIVTKPWAWSCLLRHFCELLSLSLSRFLNKLRDQGLSWRAPSCVAETRWPFRGHLFSGFLTLLTHSSWVAGLLTGLVVDSGDGVTHVVWLIAVPNPTNSECWSFSAVFFLSKRSQLPVTFGLVFCSYFQIVFISTQFQELMKSVGSDCRLFLPWMMKVMVPYFVTTKPRGQDHTLICFTWSRFTLNGYMMYLVSCSCFCKVFLCFHIFIV